MERKATGDAWDGRPILGREGNLYFERSLGRVDGIRERGVVGVAEGFKNDAVMVGGDRGDEAVESAEGRAHRSGVALEHLGAPLHIAEQEGHRAHGKIHPLALPTVNPEAGVNAELVSPKPLRCAHRIASGRFRARNSPERPLAGPIYAENRTS